MSLFNNHPAYYQISANTKVDPRSHAMLVVWVFGSIFAIVPLVLITGCVFAEFLQTPKADALFITGITATLSVASVIGVKKLANAAGGVKKGPKLKR
ncbi:MULTISPECIES: hypothetical protein [Burkholderiaceae]|uniref:hypothetical protein n=1 Tax=Burkholderiaceae TaxID=119060 RepID=UPI001177856A|nr:MULTISPECIES: hypothetical protein [Burkholderiaceae]MBY4717606.1 hypothetical protein [Ralstonia mannitolilytica]MCW5156287.1 hypothetical protein [Burkholderia cenocepacia]